MKPEPDERLARLAEITKQLAVLGEEIAGLSADRRNLVWGLSDDGYSHVRIGKAAGLSRPDLPNLGGGPAVRDYVEA